MSIEVIQDKAIIQLGLNTTIDFYQAMAEEQLKADNVVAVMADLMDPLLNLVVHAALTEDKVEETIQTVSEFYQRHHAKWFWQIGSETTPPTLSQHLIKHGLSLLETCPALYCDLSHDLPSIALPDWNIVELPAEDELHEWVKPIRESFFSSDQAEGFRQLNATLAHGQGQALHHYIGYYQGLPVSAATLFVTDQAVMIHNIATRPNYRRRGFGMAITRHVMAQAKQWGLQHCFLDSSSKGFNVYKKLGFKIYCFYQLFGFNT